MKRRIFWTILAVVAYGLGSQQSFAGQDGLENPASDSSLFLESIECRGNKDISCDFIRQKLRLPINHEILDAQVQSAKLRLSALSNFKSVDLHLEKGSEKGKAILVVEVVEASALLTEVGAGIEYGKFDDTASAPSLLSDKVSGRLSYQNLFNRQKIVELTVLNNHSTSADTGWSTLSGSLTYIDPNLFGLDRVFSSLVITQSKERIHSTVNSLYVPATNPPFPIPTTFRFDQTTSTTAMNVLLGFRLWTYSYLYMDYSDGSIRYRVQDKNFDRSSGLIYEGYVYGSTRRSYSTRLGYGWDSEDDAYFPTRGSVLSAEIRRNSIPSDCGLANCDHYNWNVAYKKNWLVGAHTVVTLSAGGEPSAIGDRVRPVANGALDYSSRPLANQGLLSIRYARIMHGNDDTGDMHRSRWYLQLGLGPFELFNHGHVGGSPDIAVLTLGVRFENRFLGVVNLYATGMQQWPRTIY